MQLIPILDPDMEYAELSYPAGSQDDLIPTIYPGNHIMSVVRDIINSFDQSDALGQAQREAVEALAALGTSKAEVFKMEIEKSLLSAGNGTNLTIPVTAILRQISDVRAYSSSEADKIGNVVKDTLGKFLKGTKESIVDGIGTLISETLSIFLGTGSASTGLIEEYYVTTEGLSIIRVDMKAWYLNVTASSIQTKMQRVTAVVATKSVVDLAKIDFSTFLNLYQQQLIESGMDNNSLKTALEEAKAIYKDFKSINNDTLMARPQTFVSIPPAARHLERRKEKPKTAPKPASAPKKTSR